MPPLAAYVSACIREEWRSTVKIPEIQWLRALAACMVLVWHSHIIFRGLFLDPSVVDNPSRWIYPLNHFHVGVDLFFVISGYIMIRIHERSAAGTSPWAASWGFLRQRLIRIFPLYWLVSLVVIIACLCAPSLALGGFTHQRRADAWHCVCSLLLVPEPRYPVLGVGWTLVYEMLFYYGFACCILLRQVRYLPLVLVLLPLVLSFLPALPVPTIPLRWSLFLLFGLGAWVAQEEQRLRRVPSPVYLLLSLVVLGLMGVERPLGLRHHLTDAVFVLTMGVFFVSLVVLTLQQGPRFAACCPTLSTALYRVGNATYSLYLLNALLLSFLGRIAHAWAHAPVLVILVSYLGALAVSIGIGWGVYLVVELPLTRWLSTRLGGKPPPLPVRRQEAVAERRR